MAATSSSVAASSHHKSYDVFISFRGEDTRKGFLSHLRDALIRKHIQTYVDDRLNKGDKISSALLKAIEDSHISIIVFSKNYATSKWCLDELLKILECKKEGQDVIPVFFEVDPSDIRKLKGSYEEAFAEHESDFNNDQDKLTKWKQALSEAANLAGWDSRIYGDESKLLDLIVQDVLKKLEYKYQLKESKYLSGTNENLAPVESLLREFQIIGIWGMGGMGKTTIAKWFFDKYSSRFEGSCFLTNIRERFGNDGHALRAELISKLLGEYERTTSVESNLVKWRLSRKRVFIVLDDVSASKQLEYLVGEFQRFGQDSRIIITTRNKHALSKGVDKIHNVVPLNFQESLRLFSLNAFNQNHPPMEYEELSNAAVDYAKGTPLVLKVLGSFLRSKTTNEWESARKKLKSVPNNEIYDVLKLSYDGLDREDREIFLDIACLLKGMHKDLVVSLLDSYGFCADIGLRTLQDNALITIEYSTVQMHDMIQEMGWEIVRQEFIKEPGERSRLWDPKEIYDVLTNNRGTNKIEGILLDMSKIRDLHLNYDTFRRMSNLRFVKFYFSSNFRDSRLHLPSSDLQLFGDKLRYLQWDGFPSKNFPLMSCLENLVELLMPKSNLEKLWDGVQDLCNLKRIDLSRSKRLVELPDFSMMSNLEEVNLSYCLSLPHVHPTLLSLHSLVALHLGGCKNLESLESECHLRSLSSLYLDGCSNLKKFSVSSEEIRELDLEDSSITQLPSSIERLYRLESLRLGGLSGNLSEELSCLRNLKELTIWDGSRLMIHTQVLRAIFSCLQSLQVLYLQKCSYLFELPDNIGVLSSLISLSLRESNVQSLPTSINQLTYLTKLDLSDCKRLGSLPELPKSIISLSVSGSNIECLPRSIRELTKLQFLDLQGNKRLQSLSPELPKSIASLNVSGSNIECLPANIYQLTQLMGIDLCDCDRLETLPELPQSVSHLSVRNCKSLKTVNSTLWKNMRIYSLYLENCVNLDEHVLSSILENAYSSIKESKKGLLNVCLPGSRVPEWFKDNRATGDSITIELDRPLQLKAFAFCTVISSFSSNLGRIYFNVSCPPGSVQCLRYTSEYDAQEWNSDHVYLWSAPQSELRLTCNLSFQLFATSGRYETTHLVSVRIKECGVCPIYRE